MTIINKINLLVLAVLLTACAPTNTHKMNKVAIGMSKQEVIESMGNPSETRATANVEYLVYRLRATWDALLTERTSYFVQLDAGKVTAYGKIGDFGSTNLPEATININKTLKEVE